MRIFGWPPVKDRYLCYDVDNFAEAGAVAIEAIEDTLGESGALIGRIDVPSATLCVLVTDHNLSDEDVTRLVESYGFRVRRRKE